MKPKGVRIVVTRHVERFLIACFLVVVGSVASAADGIVSKPLQFAKGTSSATVKGSIKGGQTVDYKLRAKAGQTMSVALKTSNASNYFNVLPPGSKDVAIFIGSNEGNEWTGALPADGEYTIRVYLMRNAARRNETANYTLTVGIEGGSAASSAAAPAAKGPDSVERAGQGRFQATGNIPCAQAKGQPMGSCPFGVARDGGGTATVVVTHADGRKRFIFFEKGKATGADLSQADGNMRFSARKNADLFLIEAGNERYEIPEAVVFGG
jgi:hypothetical protein